MADLELSEEAGDTNYKKMFRGILDDQFKSLKQQFWCISLEIFICILSFSSIFKTVPFTASVILQMKKNKDETLFHHKLWGFTTILLGQSSLSEWSRVWNATWKGKPFSSPVPSLFDLPKSNSPKDWAGFL